MQNAHRLPGGHRKLVPRTRLKCDNDNDEDGEEDESGDRSGNEDESDPG